MVEQNCKILIAFLLFLNCTIESRYWSGEGEMQKIAIPENRMVVGREPLFYLEDKNYPRNDNSDVNYLMVLKMAMMRICCSQTILRWNFIPIQMV